MKTLRILALTLALLNGCDRPENEKRETKTKTEAETAAIINIRKYRIRRLSHDIRRSLSPQALGFLKQGRISPYDSLFKKYAPKLGWDWKMLAALSYQESHFIDTIVNSRSHASGLMGIMPSTAAALDISPDDLLDPETNIRAGVEVLRRFRKGFSDMDSASLVKFTLAAYNAGLGHIQDACRLAEKEGGNPVDWDGSVSYYLTLKSNPATYADSVCRFGHIHGRRVYLYVREVIDRKRFYDLQVLSAK
jgi:membrane-bound lytic murein transglycosylase F